MLPDFGWSELLVIAIVLTMFLVQKSDLLIIAGRPSMGKTSFVLNIAQHAAIEEGKKIAFFSLEMSKESLAMRLLCSEARVDHQRLRKGLLTDTDWGRLARAAGALSDADLFIDDTPGVRVMEMRAKARRLQAEHVAAFFRGLSARIRAIFSGAPMNTETGRTA